VGRLLVFEEAFVARSNRAAGIEIRHKKSCPTNAGGFCVCDPSYRAQIWSPSDERFVRRRFTYDLYGHLMPGNEAEAAQLLDALLDRA
jgi:hypothetical protein